MHPLFARPWCCRLPSLSIPPLPRLDGFRVQRRSGMYGCYLCEAALGAEVGRCPAWPRPGLVAAGGASW